MEEPFVATFAPNGRLSPGGSHVFVDIVLGGVLLVVAVIAGYAWLVYWARARALSEEGRRKRGLRRGPVLLHGTPEAVEALPSSGAFITLTIEQTGEQRHDKNGPYVVWSEQARELEQTPFYLRLDGGERVLVEPGGRVELVDVLEPGQRFGAIGNQRRRHARITPGEPIWVRGVLFGGGGGEGPYRGGAGAPLVVRPPARGALFVSSQPIELEDAGTARFHRNFAITFFAMLVLLQATVFAEFRSLRAHGVTGEAPIREQRTWTTRQKRTVTHHVGWLLEVGGPAAAAYVTVETNANAYRHRNVGDRVPIVYLPDNPTTVQVGRRDELGASSGTVFVATACAGALLLAYALWIRHRRPWWRRKRIVDIEKGQL